MALGASSFPFHSLMGPEISTLWHFFLYMPHPFLFFHWPPALYLLEKSQLTDPEINLTRQTNCYVPGLII